ncbi:hypothetical protein [Phenylobacterium sp.]|uniref:DUF7662 domain-containing protein n=1 Tax=Phenylobacterium sp. TaxID=1871053 RepID=UPI0027347768|nr:hypothetical protein [Phenylobacterium sp.]MDP3852342.1 hypothetical protein [Phenylobacterium sp.]
MAKYDPLGVYLANQDAERVPMSFAEIEALIGAKLPDSKRYPAWWSNNEWNNVMTKVWRRAGFVSEQVDTAREKLVFRRAEARAPSERPGRRSSRGGFPGFGVMKGTVRIAVDFDLTTPADPEWGKIYE